MSNAPEVVAQPEVAPYNVFEQPDGLGFHQLVDHVAENRSNGVETFVRVADICEACLVEKDLLDDEYRDSFRKLGTSFHDAQAQGNDFGREQEVDDSVVVVLLFQASVTRNGGSSSATHLD